MKLKNGLEYELGFWTSECGEVLHEREIVDDDEAENFLFLYHTGFSGRKNFEKSPGYELLKFRAENAAKYIKASPHYAQGNYEKSFIEAFERLDKGLEELVKKISWDAIPLSAEHLWRTRYNTMVVLLHKQKQLYVAGVSHLHVGLTKGTEQVVVTSEDHNDQVVIWRRSLYAGPNAKETAEINDYTRYLRMDGKTVEEHPQLYFYNKMRVKETYEYLIIPCDDLHRTTPYILACPGTLPKSLRRYVELKGLKCAVERLAMWGSDISQAFMFALRLGSRKREHESSSDYESDITSEDEETL